MSYASWVKEERETDVFFDGNVQTNGSCFLFTLIIICVFPDSFLFYFHFFDVKVVIFVYEFCV